MNFNLDGDEDLILVFINNKWFKNEKEKIFFNFCMIIYIAFGDPNE